MTDPRSYHQNCGLARALDLLGERWTLLIVRELARGPKRFTDLEAGLEGIGTNLLAMRLKRLEAEGVARRVEIAPGVRGYALTPRGEDLRAPLDALGIWGADRLEPLQTGVQTRAAWAAMTMAAAMNRAPAPAVDGTYAFSVGDESFWLRVSGGRGQIRDGEPPFSPDAALTIEPGAFRALATGRSDLRGVAGRVDGDRSRLTRLFKHFRMPQTAYRPAPELSVTG